MNHLNIQRHGGFVDQYTPVVGGVDPADLKDAIGAWVPPEHRRRLLSYLLLESLAQNATPATESQDKTGQKAFRCGETAYYVGVLRDLVIGGSQGLPVEGADLDTATPELKEQQAVLDEWAEDQWFFPKVQDGERDCSLFGEAFYLLRQTPSDVEFKVLDPSFVFPEFVEGRMASCLVAWEEEKDFRGVTQQAIYRHRYWYEEGTVWEEAAWWSRYEWTKTVPTRMLERAVEPRSLGLTLIPIHHIPNCWTKAGFGVSDMSNVFDMLHGINNTNTDMAAASDIAGSPPLRLKGYKHGSVAGSDSTKMNVAGPGSLIHADEADYVDNSKLLTVEMLYADRLQEKLANYTRVGRLFSGQTSNLRDIESAKAVKMLLASLYALVTQKRTVRRMAYRRLLNQVMDMLMAVGKLKSLPKVALSFGNILPSDSTEDLELLIKLFAQGKGPISINTAVRMAQRAELPRVDEKVEAAAIKEQLTQQPKGQMNAGTDDGNSGTS